MRPAASVSALSHSASRRGKVEDGQEDAIQCLVHHSRDIAAIAGLFLLQALFAQIADVQVLPYSKFKQLAKERQVENLVVTEHYIRGTMKDDSGPRDFVTDRVDAAMAADLSRRIPVLRRP